jgi:hypothetical protein
MDDQNLGVIKNLTEDWESLKLNCVLTKPDLS